MQRPTVVIVSDEPGFATAATRRWLAERNVPSFVLSESTGCGRLRAGEFDLAVVGGLSAESLASVLDVVSSTGKPIVHVSRLNGHSPQGHNIFSLPEILEWPDLLVTVGSQVLERNRALAELSRLLESTSQLEHDAALGRYMVEMRHNLNNALTSILGNSDLILLDQSELGPSVRGQVETIRNMGMRMNEILQRFSSLQKEMQLADQQNGKRAKSAGA